MLLDVVPGAGLVAHTRRAAIRLGEDFITVESTVQLRPGATDAEITEAIETSMRIAKVQAAAMDAQIAQLREDAQRMPPTPPTDRQLAAVTRWQGRLSVETIAAVYSELGIEGPVPQTKAQASELIDRLKGIAEGRVPAPVVERQVEAAEAVEGSEQASAKAGRADEEDLPF
ncbi:MAG TPA: hypothetical protein VFS21_06075 [Roseiflexaceae bacterium]|nr:hypothetical protein [Roseiflexaceae bacterium]